MIKVALVKLLESAINNILALDIEHEKIKQQHFGKVLQLSITDLKQDLFFVIGKEKIFVYTTYSDRPNTILRGTFFALVKKAYDPTDLSQLSIEGDAEFAQDIQLLIKDLNINWEEYFAFFTGDFVTTNLTNFLDRLKTSVTHTQKRTFEDLVDFIHEEKRLLPTREEVEDFYEDLSSLRKNIDRLEARFQRLMEND